MADAAAGPTNRWWRVVRVGAYIVMSALLLVGALDLAQDTATLT